MRSEASEHGIEKHHVGVAIPGARGLIPQSGLVLARKIEWDLSIELGKFPQQSELRILPEVDPMNGARVRVKDSILVGIELGETGYGTVVMAGRVAAGVQHPQSRADEREGSRDSLWECRHRARGSVWKRDPPPASIDLSEAN